jgi:hypothetical protein
MRRCGGDLGQWEDWTLRQLFCVYPLAQLEGLKVAFPLDGIKLVVIGGHQRNLQSLRKRQCKRIGIGNSLLNFECADPFDERIIHITTKFERKV